MFSVQFECGFSTFLLLSPPPVAHMGFQALQYVEGEERIKEVPIKAKVRSKQLLSLGLTTLEVGRRLSFHFLLL